LNEGFSTYIVDNHGDRLYINTTGEHIGGDEHFRLTASELIDNAVTVLSLESTAQLSDFVALSNHALLELLGSSSCLYTLVIVGTYLHALLTLTKMIDDAWVMRP
jgi:hypothetical protein